jgi:Threonine dehydrogenase and related Zn-dependent dehydrogenases
MRAVQFRKSVLRFAIVKTLGKWLPKVMTSPLGMVALREVESLKLPSPRWVRIRPRLCGICGSDTAVITAKSSLLLSPLTSVPFTFGHEIVGEVIEVGSGVSKVRVGDRVVVEPALSCFVREIEPPCPRCSEGNYACCERVTEGIISAGIQTGYCRDTGGGWSDELVAHEWQLFKVPDELDDEIAVLTEPFSCALHSVLKAIQCFQSEPKRALSLAAGQLGC